MEMVIKAFYKLEIVHYFLSLPYINVPVKVSTKDPRADMVAGVTFHTQDLRNNEPEGATLKSCIKWCD